MCFCFVAPRLCVWGGGERVCVLALSERGRVRGRGGQVHLQLRRRVYRWDDGTSFMPEGTFERRVKFPMTRRHLQGFAASWKSTSASPTPAWTGVRARTCQAATPATASSASRATTATSTSTSVAAPPVCTEAPASTRSTISGGLEPLLTVSVATTSFMKPSSTFLLRRSRTSPRCQCADGYRGRLCEVDIDECDPNPCVNGASCLDGLGSFACRCLPGFNGTRCETGTVSSHPGRSHTCCPDSLARWPGFLFNILFAVLLEMSSAFNLDFEVSGIHGYVMMDGVMPSLTEITCTFWMKSSDTTNYGTPISYAVEGSDNAFLLIDYNGSVKSTFFLFFVFFG